MILTRAPLRIPLGGGGTDFPSYYLRHGGLILGFAIDKYVHCVVNRTIDKKIRLKYSKTECVSNLDELENRVAAEALRWYGFTEGIEVATFSDVPESSGLGGSSAFCVALVAALRKMSGLPLNKYEIFSSAYEIERVKANQPGGIQDQFFASFGGAWCLELGQKFTKEKLDVNFLLPALKLVYTNTGRTDLGIAGRQTSSLSSKDVPLLENLHQVKVLGSWIRDYISRGQIHLVGKAFHEHWEVKKKRDDGITNSTVDETYERARQCGALGGKLVGVGGGGYLLLCAPEGLEGFNCVDFSLDTKGVKVVYDSN